MDPDIWPLMLLLVEEADTEPVPEELLMEEMPLLPVLQAHKRICTDDVNSNIAADVNEMPLAPLLQLKGMRPHTQAAECWPCCQTGVYQGPQLQPLHRPALHAALRIRQPEILSSAAALKTGSIPLVSSLNHLHSAANPQHRQSICDWQPQNSCQ